MSAIEILSPGALASVQDAGRRGWRRIGIPWSGVVDSRLLRIANRLVGNPEHAPAIECFDGGQQLVARDGPVRVAVAGDATLQHIDADGAPHKTLPWRSLTLAAGESLRIVHTGGGRIAVLAVAGMACESVMGSAATYGRARLGGIDGRALQVGDRLRAEAAAGAVEQMLPNPPLDAKAPIRAVAGPQDDHFTEDSVAHFFSGEWTLTAEADRMGLRLAGEALKHVSDAAREIVSDAIVPGSVQVPGNGQPIVLLADSHTAGGYPKIATVISADLGRLAACKPGQMLRFVRVDAAEAEAIAREADAALKKALDAIVPLSGESHVDLKALYNTNLLSGMVNALAPDEHEDTESEI